MPPLDKADGAMMVGGGGFHADPELLVQGSDGFRDEDGPVGGGRGGCAAGAGGGATGGGKKFVGATGGGGVYGGGG